MLELRSKRLQLRGQVVRVVFSVFCLFIYLRVGPAARQCVWSHISVY